MYTNIPHADQNLFEEEDLSYHYTDSLQPNWKKANNRVSAVTKKTHNFQSNDILYHGLRLGSTAGLQSGSGLQLGSAAHLPLGSTAGLRLGSTAGFQLGNTAGFQLGNTAGFQLGNTAAFQFGSTPAPTFSTSTSSTSSGVVRTGRFRAPTSIIIDLSRVYLVNNIVLELVKSSSPYIIQVSRDNRTWRQLIDYLMMCSSRQVLWFPKQAVRYHITVLSSIGMLQALVMHSFNFSLLCVPDAGICSLFHLICVQFSYTPVH